MTKQSGDVSCLGKYIAWGLIIGSALGTGCAVLMKSMKKQKNCKCQKKSLHAS